MPSMTRQRDATLIEDLAPLVLADYEYLRYSNERSLQEAFIAGDIAEPNLIYKDIELVPIDDDLDSVRVLEEVVGAYSDELVRRAYLPKLEETRRKYQLLQAAFRGDDQGVYDASVRMYGIPRDDIFRYSLRELRACMDSVDALLGSHPAVAHALTVLEPHVAMLDHTNLKIAEIPSTSAELTQLDQSQALSADAIQRAFEAAFQEHGIRNWRAVVDAPGERRTFNTNQELRIVFIPSDADLAYRKYALTSTRVQSIVAHEIGTHVVRRERGSESPLALLGVGLAGYLRGEEGIATYMEQQQKGTRHFSGAFGYLAVGWSVGLDGVPRTFRGLYELLVPYCIVVAIEHAHAYGRVADIDSILKKAPHQAWARCIRTFRGTSGATPGACYTKDIVYREGNMAIWDLVTKDPRMVETFSLGKFDPANSEHMQLLHDLRML